MATRIQHERTLHKKKRTMYRSYDYEGYTYHRHILKVMLARKSELAAELGRQNSTIGRRAALGAFFGGVLLGPVGVGLGGIVGSMTSMMSSSEGQYDALVNRIEQLDFTQIKRLELRVQVLVEYSDAYNLESYLENQKNRENLIKLLKEF